MKKISLLLCLVAMAFSASAANYYVKPADLGGSDANDGLSWETAKAKITAAYALASTGDVVCVMQGEYVFVSGDGFSLKSDVRLEGGYTGNGDERVINPENTVVTGYDGTNARLFSGGSDGVDVTAYVSGFTFQGQSNTTQGAVAILRQGTTFEDCIFKDNVSTDTGNTLARATGGVFCFTGSSPGVTTIRRCKFINNSSAVDNNGTGGAIGIGDRTCQASEFHIENCYFEGNVSGGPGSAIYVYSTSAAFTVNISNCIFVNHDETKPVIASGDRNATDTPCLTNINISNCLFANNGSVELIRNAGQKGLNNIFWNTQPVTGGVGTFDYSASNIAVDGENSGTVTAIVDSVQWFGENYSQPDFFPGVNGGTTQNITLPTTDYAGNPRVYGSTVDIGPYEMQQYRVQTTATGGVTIAAGSTADGYYPNQTAVTVNFTSPIAPYVAIPGYTATATNTGGDNYTLAFLLTRPAKIQIAPTPKWLTIANVASVSIISTTSEADGTHGGDYPVIEGGDFTMLFKLKNDCQTISVSEGELSAPTADGVYTWTLRNVTADTNVSFNITTKEYTVTFHIGSGITDLTDDSGDELPALTFTTECGSYYDFWFNVAPGYHSPMVSINGVLLDEAYFYEEDEHYTFYLDEIKQNIDIYLSAFEQYAIPVTYDLDANSAPTGIHSPIIRISRETYGTMAFIKFLTPVDALPTDFNTIELKMKIKTPSTTSGIYPLAWIDNYRSTNSASEATEEEWTEDNYTYATRPLFKQEVDRVTVTPDLTEDLVWKFSESTIADIKTFLEDAQILGTQEALSFRCDPIKIDNVSVRIDVYSREGALTADQMPTIIFKSLPVTTVNTTVTANHVTILSGEGAVQVREGYPYVLSFELESGYENPTVTINGDAYTPTLINDAYQVEISTPPTTMTINVSATKIQVPVTATIGAGVTNVTGVAETVSWGEPLPTITYQLASGYTRTLVVLNNKVVTPTVSGGTYTISVPDSVLATQKLGIYAFTASEYPVSADTHVRGSTFENTNYASVDSLLIEYSVYSIPYYVYHSYLEFPIDASAITAGETVNLRLKLKKVEKPALSPLPVIVSTVPYDSTDPTNTPAAINEVNDMTWFLNGETEYDAATTEIVAQFTVANDAQPGTIYTIELNKSKIAAAVRDGKLRLRLAVANESDDDIDDENDGHIQFYSMEANNPTCVPTIVIGAPKTITVATTHAVVLAGDPTAVTGTAYTLIFKPETGYTHPTVTVNGTAATVTRADSIYTLIVPNVTADLSIDITCSEIVWRTLTVTSSGVTFTKTPPTQIADGDPYTLTFTLQSGYENPVVTVDGTAYTLAAPVNGVYTITIATVSADVTIDIASTNTGLYDVVPQVVAVKYYTLQGMEVRQPSQDGIYIVKRIYDNQQTKVSKEIIRRR